MKTSKQSVSFLNSPINHLVVVCTILAILLPFSSPLILHAENPRAELKIVSEYYPAPYDKMVEKARSEEDAVIAIFRAFCTARTDKKPASLSSFLAKALSEYHNVTTANLKQSLLSMEDSKAVEKRMNNLWNKLALDGDRAAFARLFRIMPETIKGHLNLAEIEKQAFEAEKALAIDEVLADYASQIPPQHQYEGKITSIGWVEKASDKVDELILRVKGKVSQENLIRFLARVNQKAGSGLLKNNISDLQKRLSDKLVSQIDAELKALVEDNLFGSEITLIALTESGNLQLKQSLIKGRLRLFSKRIQELETKLDKETFIPIVNRLAMILKTHAGKGSSESKKYLNMVADTLETIKIIKLRPINRSDDSEKLAKFMNDIGHIIAEQDAENYLQGIDRLL